MPFELKKGVVYFDIQGTLDSETREEAINNTAINLIKELKDNHYEVCSFTTAPKAASMVTELEELGIPEENQFYGCKKSKSECYINLEEKTGYPTKIACIVDDSFTNVIVAKYTGAKGIIHESFSTTRVAFQQLGMI